MTYKLMPKDSSKGIYFGMVIMTSSKAEANAPYITFLPGIGGKGNGTESELQSLYNNEVPSNLKAGIEKYGFICIAVQSSSAYTLGEAKFALDYALRNLNIDKNRRYLTGLSWGGGGTAYFAASSLENALMYDAIAPIAMTWQTSGSKKNVVDANLPVWAFHNLKDNNGGTPVAATNQWVDGVNALNPKVKATKTLFMTVPIHGGWGEAYSPTTIPIGPGSEGFIDPACNLYEWFLMNNATTRVAPPSKTDTAPTIPTVPSSPEPSANEIVIKQTGTYPNIKLDASDTANRKSVRWTVKSVPTGRSIWELIVMSGQWHFTDVVLPTKGTYGIECYVTFKDNTTASKLLSITWGDVQEPEPPQPIIVDIPVPEREIRLIFSNGNKYVLSHTKLEDIVNNYITE